MADEQAPKGGQMLTFMRDTLGLLRGISAGVADGFRVLAAGQQAQQKQLDATAAKVDAIYSFLLDPPSDAPAGLGPEVQLDQRNNVTQRPTD